MADRIEAGTFCVAATLTKGNLEIKDFNPDVIRTELKLLRKAGARITIETNKITIIGPEKIKPIKDTLSDMGEMIFDLQDKFTEGEYLKMMNLLQSATNGLNSL